MKEKIKKAWLFISNPHFLICFFIAWFITNGWSYLFFVLGSCFEIKWMTVVGGAWITFLWVSVFPEKIFTAAIAIVLLRLIFPKDEKTLAVLKSMRIRLLEIWNNRKQKIKNIFIKTEHDEK